MFESDQHEFDEEYAEASHPAPPSPPKPAAVKTEPVKPKTEPVKPAVYGTTRGSSGLGGAPAFDARCGARTDRRRAARGRTGRGLLRSGGVGGVCRPGGKARSSTAAEEETEPGADRGIRGTRDLCDRCGNHPRPKSNAPNPGDLGPGIVAVDGLRGHLDTVWEGDAKTGRLVYKLRIEPMEDRWGKGFSRVTSNAPMPLSVNIRLLDSTGFALCGKEIDFRFNPETADVQVPAPPLVGANGKKLSVAERNAALQAARQSEIAQMQAAEVIRERGKDIFQNQTTDEGQVTAVNVQGSLPCSPDQYRHTDYWDFNTNFPTLEQQAALLDPQHGKEFAPPPHPGKRNLAKLQVGFVIQGDDRVTGYDSARGVLTAEQKTFTIDKRYGQAAAIAVGEQLHADSLPLRPAGELRAIGGGECGSAACEAGRVAQLLLSLSPHCSILIQRCRSGRAAVCRSNRRRPLSTW